MIFPHVSHVPCATQPQDAQAIQRLKQLVESYPPGHDGHLAMVQLTNGASIFRRNCRSTTENILHISYFSNII